MIMAELGGLFTRCRDYVACRWLLAVEAFIRTEQLGSVLLLAATAAALAWVNSPWHESYFHFWETEIGIDLGLFSIEEHLQDWVNDGLVAIFFFVVGMEIKRELAHGELSSVRKAALPAVAALGGMVVPAAIFIAFNATGEGAKVTFFDGEIGRLAPGMRADMVLIGLERISEPFLHPDTDIVDALVYRGKGSDVDTVIVNGEVLLRRGELTKLDKAEIVGRFKESLARPMSQREVERGELSRLLLPYVQRFFEGWPLEHGAPHYYYNDTEL